MCELTSGVSWLAVGVGFVLSFMLGWLWYSPKGFGKQWAEGVGVALSDGKSMPMFAMITQALGTFCLSWLFGITAGREALLTIVLIIVTIILIVVSNGKFAGKSNTAIRIEATYILAMSVVMFACQAIF
jgi:hypothetical protein